MDTQRFQRVADAMDGRIDGAFLVKFPRESKEKFERRKEIAWYVNHVLPAAQRFAGYIASKTVTRDVGGNPLLTGFLDDCDWRGNSLAVWMQAFCVDAKARGTMFCLVDMPQAVPTDMGTQIDQRVWPYLVPIEPERVTKHRTNERGMLTMIAWDETVYDDAGEAVTQTREWTETQWSVSRDGSVIAQGDHQLGMCPVLIFTEMDEFPCYGPFCQIADISIRLFNLHSELDEILRSQTFSMLTYHVPPEMESRINAARIVEDIGTHNMLIHYGNAPAFAAPESGPASTYMEVIDRLEQQIRDISMTMDEPPKYQESGIAIQLKFQGLNASLSSFARRMEDFERRIFSTVAAWLNIQLGENVTIEWPKDFNLADMATEMVTLQQAQASGLPGSYIRAKMKQIVSLDLGALEQGDADEIMDEIDAMATEVEQPSEGDDDRDQD